ncbi:MAG: hypothetical protein FWF80_02610, partial [Defluviitaleaceae bacterium]|nr:hypothetical protein [Defluviitaleaceae bacterium]
VPVFKHFLLVACDYRSVVALDFPYFEVWTVKLLKYQLIWERTTRPLTTKDSNRDKIHLNFI